MEEQNPVLDKVAATEVELDNYEANLGLPRLSAKPDGKIQEILETPPDVLCRWSQDQKAEARMWLATFGLFLQRTLNKELSRLKTLEAIIELTTDKLMADQKGYGLEEKRLLAIQQVPNAKAAKIEKLKIGLRLNRLYGLVHRIEVLRLELGGASHGR